MIMESEKVPVVQQHDWAWAITDEQKRPDGMLRIRCQTDGLILVIPVEEIKRMERIYKSLWMRRN
jgi:hypothetical protein